MVAHGELPLDTAGIAADASQGSNSHHQRESSPTPSALPSLDPTGDAEETMTKYWRLHGAPHGETRSQLAAPTSVCNAAWTPRSGNDAPLTMQAVTTIELTPADVCVNCGLQLLEELEVKDQA